MDEQRMKEEEKQRQIEEEKKKVFRISKKPRPPEEITEQTDKSAKLSAQEKLEKAKKLAASFGKAKTVVFSSKFDSNKSSAVSDKSSSKHKHDKPSHSEQKRKSGNDKHSNDKDVSRQTVKKPSNDKHSNDKDVPKQSDKKPSYKDKLEKMSDQEKLAIIKKISGSLGRVGDKISDTEKLDKIRKISETIGKGSSSNSDKNEKPNGYPKYSPLSSKIDRDKMTGNFESLQKIKKKFKEAEERVNGKTITMLGKTDEGIKREVIFDRTDAETMRYALQEKAAQIRAMINKPEKPKPRERKKGKNRASETEAKGKKSETSKNEDDEERKYSDFKKSSSHSSDTKYNYKYSDDKSSDRSSREEKPVKKKKPPPPTSMNFNHNNDLLKIAEQKSQEPVKIEVIKKPKKEEERFLTKREMASQREYQEYLKNKKIRREAEIEEKQTVDVKREKQISNSLKSKSTSNLVTKSASSSQNTVRKNPYPEKLDTKSSSPVPSSSKLSSSSKLGKSMSSSSIPSKPFIKQFKLHSATNSQHNSDSNPAKKIKREHIEKERISQKGEHRKKSNGAKRSSHDDVRENVLVCGPPKNEKPVSSNPFDRIYGEIKKNQPTKPEPKPRERKKGKDRASETEAKGKKSETSKNEDDEQRKYSDFKKSSSLSSDTKYNDKYSDDKSSDRSSREEKPVKKKKPPPPTSMHFNHNNDLLKIAEQKSQEPVKIEVIKKPKKEEERLLTKREMASQSEYQEYSKNKKIRREAEIEEKQTVDVKREKQISNSLKSKSTSNLVTKSASSSQNTVRKNRYSEKLATNSSSPVPSSSKPTSSNKLNKSMSSSSIPSKPFTKQFKLHSATNSQHNSDSNPAKKIKREHTENERISQKDEHRKKSNGAKRSNYNDVRENVLVCGPPKNEKPVCSNPFDRIYGEIKKNQPTKPEPKPRERKKGKDRASETEAKGKKSETSKNEDDEERKYSDFKKSSSLSSDTKYNDKYSDDKSSDRSSREEKPVKKKKPPPPTSMHFNHNNDLLKIAEQKSQEPVKIEVIKKPKKEEERLLTKREMASQSEYQEYSKNKKIRREAEIEEKQTVDVKREKQISNSLKSKSTSNLVTKSASSSQNTVRKNRYSEKLATNSSSPVPSSSKPTSSNKLNKSMSSSSIPSKPFTKQFKLHSATNSQHNSDSNPAKKIKREHTENERISQKDEHRKKSNGAKRSNYNDVRENVLVCGPPKNEKPVCSNPFDRIYGEIKKNQPTKPEPKPRERKKGKDRASETEAKGKKSETSKNEDDEERKYSDFKKSSSHSSDTKYNDKYSDDKSSDRSSREEKPVKKKKPPPPTSMNFNHNNDLLKIAEQKSQEHIKIEVTKKPQKGEERLLTKREMASQREYQEYLKNKTIRREAEIEERQTVDVKREKQISNSLKSKSTSNLVTKSASSSQNTVRKNPYSEKLVTKSSSPVPNSSKPSPSNKLGKSMSSSSIPSKPFTKQFKLHSATNSQHNSDSNPAKKIKREHREDERISQKDEHRKKSNGAKRSNYNDVRENVLVCGPPKNEKPVSSNPFDRMYGEIKKNQPTKPGSLDQIRQAVIVKTDNMATSNKRRATDTRGTIKGTKRSKGTNDLDQPTPPTSEIVLRIIAKTNMNNGYCYLGFDEEHERIFRPIFNTNTCCWPFEKDFCWKKSYRFLETLNPYEDKVYFLTPYPHCNEDMVVTSIVKEEKTVPFNVQVLISVAKLDINDIFLDIKEEKYLFNNAQSPSAGILKCRSRNVSICSDDHSKDSRFKIHLPSGHYVFPMKGINIDEIPKVDREVLVVFGLGRPYTNRRSFHPARCYILVVGLFVV